MPDANMTPDVMTAEELERVSIPGKTTELIRGRLIVSEPPGPITGGSLPAWPCWSASSCIDTGSATSSRRISALKI